MVDQDTGEAQEVHDTWNGEEKGRINYARWTGTTTFQLDPEESDTEEMKPEEHTSALTGFGVVLPSDSEVQNDEVISPEADRGQSGAAGWKERE